MIHVRPQTDPDTWDSSTATWRQVSWLSHSWTSREAAEYPPDPCSRPIHPRSTWNLKFIRIYMFESIVYGNLSRVQFTFDNICTPAINNNRAEKKGENTKLISILNVSLHRLIYHVFCSKILVNISHGLRCKSRG